MAASLLRLGQLSSVKGLQVNSWITLKRGPALWFCTQTNEPKKPVKKTKAVGKTEAPDERAVLSHWTASSFPVRLPEPGGFPVGGTEDSVTADSAQSATAAAEGEAAPRPLEPFEGALAGATEKTNTASSKPKDTAADESPSSSSSSSSDSDSDSDSDSEDEKVEGEAKIRNVSQEFPDGTSGVNKGTTDVEISSKAPADLTEDDVASLITEAHSKTPSLQVLQAGAPAEVSSEPVEVTKESQTEAAAGHVKSKSLLPETAAETDALSTTEDLKDPVLVSAEATGEDLKDPVLVSAEATGEDLKDPVLVSAEATGEDLKDPVLVSAEATGEDLKDPVLVSAEATGEDLKDPVLVSAEATGEDLKDPVLVSAEATGEDLKDPVLVSAEATGEDLKDPVLVSAEATGEDPPVETAAEQLEEPTAAAEPPEPEEPFDNSTYKNCQHHSYTPYTFVDLDVDMAKYRLPQPSSGRPSPQH